MSDMRHRRYSGIIDVEKAQKTNIAVAGVGAVGMAFVGNHEVLRHVFRDHFGGGQDDMDGVLRRLPLSRHLRRLGRHDVLRRPLEDAHEEHQPSHAKNQKREPQHMALLAAAFPHGFLGHSLGRGVISCGRD